MMAYVPGTNGNDVLFGDIFGFPEDDTLDGLEGADEMHGGDGSDTYYVDNVDDTASEFYNDEAGGHDVVYASASHKLGFGIEDLHLTGFENINGTGNGNANVITGNSGKNTIDGKAGADTMDGGDGSDTYIVDNKLDKVGEQFNDALGGVDLVKSSVSYVLSHMDKGIENLTLTGSAHLNGTGNGNANVITGNSGNNILKGLDGADTLIGGGGKDTLTGGTGFDKFVYKSISDSPAGTGRDVITDFKGNGSAAGDKIDLQAIDANQTTSTNDKFIFGGPHTAGHLWYANGVLNGNVDNDAAVEFQIQLTGAPSLHVSDIVL
jgi:Ca2+-binding RTX toxin-like protein